MMENISENNTEATELPVVQKSVPVGTVLREARERLGLSVIDVAGQIKFAPRQIEALEAGDLEQLPEIAFVRGFVRSYAKVLKLDPQELLATLAPVKDVPGELTPASVNVPYPNVSLAHRQNMIWVGVTLIVLLIAVFVMRSNIETGEQGMATNVETPVVLPEQAQLAGESGGEEQAQGTQLIPVVETARTSESKPQPVAKVAVTPAVMPKPAVTPKSAVPPSPSAMPRMLGAIRVEFVEESWLEVKDADENILTSQNYPAGSEARLEGNLPISVLVGHAPSVHLYFKDKEVDLVPHTRRSTDVAHVVLGK